MPGQASAQVAMNQDTRESLRMRVRHFYDVQKLRIAFGNRASDPDDYVVVVGKDGKETRRKKPQGKKQMEAALVDLISLHNQRASDAIEMAAWEAGVRLRPAEPIVMEKDRRFYHTQSLVLRLLELDTLDDIDRELCKDPVYQWACAQKGCGKTMAAVLLSEVQMCTLATPEELEGQTRVCYDVRDVHGATWKYFRIGTKQYVEDVYEGQARIRRDVCPTISSLWHYAGLHTNPETGKAVRRQRGVKIDYNPFLKSKLWVLAGCFLKSNSPWREHYDNTKNRWKSANKGDSDAHRHAAALRPMMKAFLAELWRTWRPLESLPVLPSYAESVLHRVHGDHGGTGRAAGQ